MNIEPKTAGKPLEGKERWIVLVIVIMATFMAALDGSIVNVALPQMAKALSTSAANIQLVVTSYLIVIVALVLIFGRLGDLFGKSRIFSLGLMIFTLGSLLCGLSQSLALLVVARVIQAIGAAATMANSQGIITEIFPLGERGRALGFNGTAVALGSLVGPGLGGLIVETFHWEYIFLINVPVGLVVQYFVFRLVPQSGKVQVRKGLQNFDGLGAVLFITSICCFFIGLSAAQHLGFNQWKPLLLLGVSLLSFLLFLVTEKKRTAPLLDLKIFENKLFSLSIFCGFITFVSIFCNNIIQPFYLQDVLRYNPAKAGLVLMIYPTILMFAAPLSGYLSDKVGSEILTFIGLCITSLGLLLMATLGPEGPIGNLLAFIALMSLGMGLFQSPNNALVMSTVSKDKLGIAGSVNALVRNLGMVCGVTLATSLLYAQMSSKMGQKVTDYVVGRSDVFLYGMKSVYVTAGLICLFGALLTFLRMGKRPFPKKK